MDWRKPNGNPAIRTKKNIDSNDNSRSERKDWSSLFNGHSNDRRNNRDGEAVAGQPKAIASHNKSDETPRREPNSRYGFKQSIPNAPKNVSEDEANWRDEKKSKTAKTNLENIPLPRQFMELSLLEKQTKAKLERHATTSANIQASKPSSEAPNIVQLPSGNAPKESAADSSDLLRKLLRISDQMPSSPSTESRPLDFLLNKSTPANTNVPFPNQVPAKMLPKPPSDWTGKEQTPKVQMPSNPHAFPIHPHPHPQPMPLPFINNAPNGFPFGQGPPPPFMPPPFNPNMNPNMFNVPMNVPMPNHPGMMRPFLHMGPQIAANFNAFPNQMGLQPSAPVSHIKQGPIGPQNLSNNSKHLPGHGAFIPLQAIRKNTKSAKPVSGAAKSNPLKPNKEPPLTEQEIIDKIDQFKRQIQDDERNQLKQQSSKQPQQQPLQPSKKNATRGSTDNGNGVAPRPKRLACKFDLPPA